MGRTAVDPSPRRTSRLARAIRSFDPVAAINPFSSFVLTGRGEPVRLIAAAVSWDFFSMLGTRPALGRGFLPEEDQPGRNRVVIMSHALWVERFGRGRTLLGIPSPSTTPAMPSSACCRRSSSSLAKASDFQARTVSTSGCRWRSARRRPGLAPLRVFARLKPASRSSRPRPRSPPRRTLAAAVSRRKQGEGHRCRPAASAGDRRRPAPLLPCSPPWVSCWPLPAPTSRI